MIISKKAREQYNIESSFINYEGVIAIFDDYLSAKLLAEKVNKIRQAKDDYEPDKYVRPSVVNALGILDELYINIMDVYFKEYGDDLRDELIDNLITDLGEKEFLKVLKRFTDVYPSNKLYSKKATFEEYFNSKSDGKSNKHLIIEEVILAYLSNENKGINEKAYGEFLDNSNFISKKSYKKLFTSVDNFFQKQAFFPNNSSTTLIDFLQEPLTKNEQLENQLKYISTYWAKYLDSKMLSRLLKAVANILEENDLIWRMFPRWILFSNSYLFR